jgi:hypothetical protein
MRTQTLTIYDRGSSEPGLPDGAFAITLQTVDAHEWVRRDPKRYSYEKPTPSEPAGVLKSQEIAK